MYRVPAYLIVENRPLQPGLHPIAQAEVCAPKDFEKRPVNSCPMRLVVQVRPINIKERWLIKGFCSVLPEFKVVIRTRQGGVPMCFSVGICSRLRVLWFSQNESVNLEM